jgi:hypothetical protein
VEGGIDLTEAQAIAARLAATGAVDYFGVSQGNFSKSLEAHAPDMHFPPAPFRPLARGIREAARGVPVYAMARFATPDDAEAALEAGDADLVGMSRALIADAALPAKARAGRTDAVRPCIMCNVCWGAIPLGRPLFCIYNPSVGHEGTLDADAPPPAETVRRVVVVGGGLAGMEAARVAALRGHRVTLLERAPRLGGQAVLAERLPGRADFGRMTRWLVRQVERLPVDVRLGHEAGAGDVLALAPDAVVVATGSRPSVGLPDGPAARLAGAPPGAVVSTWDVLERRARLGARVALLDYDGEHEATGTAELLAAEGRRVWLVTPFEFAGFYENYLSRIGMMRRLLTAGVTILAATEARAFGDEGLVVENLYSRRPERLPVESVVLAGPNRAEDGLVAALRGRVAALHAVGDCYAPRKASAAVHEGHRAGRLL